MKWDIYEIRESYREYVEKDGKIVGCKTKEKSHGYMCVTGGAELRESRFDNRMYGIFFKKVSPEQPDIESGEFLCDSCGMAIHHGGGISGITIHDTCPFCGEGV